MQTLVSQITATFIDDAIELVKGFGKALAHVVTAPLERIANAADVAGVLAQRQSVPRSLRAVRNTHRPRSRRNGFFALFASLNQLT
jgi:hypothetical protein